MAKKANESLSDSGISRVEFLHDHDIIEAASTVNSLVSQFESRSQDPLVFIKEGKQLSSESDFNADPSSISEGRAITQATDDDSNIPKLVLSLTHSPPTPGTALQNSKRLLTELATLRADLAEKNLEIEKLKEECERLPQEKNEEEYGHKQEHGISKGKPEDVQSVLHSKEQIIKKKE